MEWSNLLPELLDKIAHKHIVFYEDYHPFTRVCNSWLSTTKGRYSNGPPSRLPSLMLTEKKDDEEFRELFLLSNDTIRKIRLPEAFGKLCMSSCGWLVTVGDDHASQLINPLSREIFNLPKIDTFPEFLELSEWDNGIRKLVLVTNNPSSLPLVVVLWGCSGKLGFCWPGDNKWTAVDKGWGGKMLDITYFNGRIYSFDCNFHIRACDVYGENPTRMVGVSRLPVDIYAQDKELGGAYIIGLDDGTRKRLLVVIREGVLDDIQDELCEETYKTKSFQILEYDLASKRWSKVKDFGGKTLFVGYSSSFWIEDTTRVIKSNCIYFTDDVFVMYRGSKNGGGRDMGIYHLRDGTIEPHFAGKSRSNLTPPIWLETT
ncbi:hypothetical protein CTI12_AA009460 [Artemisia annua]|uniref:KIB1-4 beta-propeller domain-containing protein n=1 Tax=Artemisia annua TaxID=35608 RepID=A0A2U1QHB7_ARTAN|nr:hypothetical protein CTI12_AA009460 [Artemisia annua]